MSAGPARSHAPDSTVPGELPTSLGPRRCRIKLHRDHSDILTRELSSGNHVVSVDIARFAFE